MAWEIFLDLSITFFLISLFLSVFLLFRKNKAGRLITPFNTLFAGTMLSVFIALIPVLNETLREYSSNLLRVILFTMHETMQVFTLDVDREILLENIHCINEAIASFYVSYLSFLFVLAPILTFSFLFSFIQSIKAFRKYLMHFFSDVYAFSDINEKSVSLAQDLKKNHPKSLVVFSCSSDDADEWDAKARESGAILFSNDFTSFQFACHSSKAQITFFAISENESRNIRMALSLIDLYKERENTSVFAVSANIEGELLLSNADKGKVKVRRIDEVRSLIYHELYNQGTTLFDHALIQKKDDRKKISAVIIGLGKHGYEMFKALSWFCQMDGYSIVIDAFDQDENAEERISVLCPELLSKDLNGSDYPGDAQYTIRIHSGVDITTKSFFDEIGKLTETTYVLVALGSDEMNLRTAVALRQQFEKMKLNHKPTIQAIIYNTEQKNALKNLKNFRGKEFEIEFIGDIKSSYSEDIIMNSTLEQEALKGHMEWGNESDFWNYEYNYRSSMAAAIHRKAREKCKITGADKMKEELTGEERTIIESLEHRRWNAYMRSEGYIFTGSTDKATRNDLGKMHPDLVAYSILNEKEKRKDSNVGSKKK